MKFRLLKETELRETIGGGVLSKLFGGCLGCTGSSNTSKSYNSKPGESAQQLMDRVSAKHQGQSGYVRVYGSTATWVPHGG